MAGNAVDPDDESGDETPDRDETSGGKSSIAKATAAKPATPFFTIYKKGQGKWTRLGTAGAGLILASLTAYNLYLWVVPYLPIPTKTGPADHTPQRILLAGCALVFAAMCLLTFWIGNKSSNVDFLIATDNEMKKVNWTTQGELLGSTRVVVLFLIFIGCFLALVDAIFAEFFHLIHVLQ